MKDNETLQAALKQLFYALGGNADDVRETDDINAIILEMSKLDIGAGGALPAVTSEDNGDVLTVVNGEWDKAAPGGGGSGGEVFIIQEYYDEETGESTYKANMPPFVMKECDYWLFVDSDGQKSPLVPAGNRRFIQMFADPNSSPSFTLVIYDPDFNDSTGLTFTKTVFVASLEFTSD